MVDFAPFRSLFMAHYARSRTSYEAMPAGYDSAVNIVFVGYSDPRDDQGVNLTYYHTRYFQSFEEPQTFYSI